jgi:hypothetical protein
VRSAMSGQHARHGAGRHPQLGADGVGSPSLTMVARALCAPDMRITGSTGKIHGEMPVISPPTTPMAMSVNISVGEPFPG